jgi:cellulose synthase/poly-beta-1,6-N-acetylglucosamine synthase-like glycosyltransferase
MTSSESPRLSIVITSYTMERLADVCDLLDSIKHQRFTDDQQLGGLSESTIETIFIAEGSHELYERVEDYVEKIGLRNFKAFFSAEKLYLSGARRLGAKFAKGEIVAFVDDDSVLFPEWAEEMVASYQDESVIGVSGAALPAWQGKGLDWLPKNFYWIISCTDWTGWDELREARSLWGMNMSLRREAFEKTDPFLSDIGHRDLFLGYREPPIAEDLEFSLRVKRSTGKRLLYNPKARVWHKVYAYRTTSRFVASRAHHIGVSRRVLRKAGLKEQAKMSLEKGVVNGIFGIIYSLPRDFFKSPVIAWKKSAVTATVIVFAALGFLFPGDSLQAAGSIRNALK